MFVVDAKILGMDKFEVAIVEFKPDRAPADKELVETLATAAINTHSDELIREINRWLAEHQRCSGGRAVPGTIFVA